MNNQKEIFSKEFRKLNYLAFFLLVFGIYGASFAIVKATPSPAEMEVIENMSEEERQAFMQEKRENNEDFAGEKISGQGVPGQEMSEEKKAQNQEVLIKRIAVAKNAFERNRMRLRVARNIATSTVSQLKLEGTDVEELLANLREFETRMDEIETLYQNYLDKLLLFERDRGEDPGDINYVFKQGNEKRKELLAFYKDTFRENFEDALSRNEDSKK